MTATAAESNFSVTQIAYTRNFASTIRPAPATKMFDVDSTNSDLLRQNPPNTGKLELTGDIGGGLNNFAGFDVVGGDDGTRVIAARVGTAGPFGLFDINLGTGAATAAGALIGTGATNQIGGATGPADLRDLAIIYNQQ
jgi:hypothetical protein